MLSLTRTARRARALDAALDAQRVMTLRRLHELHRGVHEKLVTPTAMVSTFAAGIIAGHFSEAGQRRKQPSAQRETRQSPLHAALEFGRWAFRLYLTRKVAGFLNTVT
ncbi:MAG: hypothetical protein ACREVN_05620 [Gammaproteobacteria bacterium]